MRVFDGDVDVDLVDDVLEVEERLPGEAVGRGREIRLDDERRHGVHRADALRRPALELEPAAPRRRLALLRGLVHEVVAIDRVVPPKARGDALPAAQEMLGVGGLVEHVELAVPVLPARRHVQVDRDLHAEILDLSDPV